MSSHRIRIFSSLLIAFIIVNIYGNLTGIKNALANIKLDPSGLKKLFSLNIKFPESSDLKPLTKYNGNVNYKQISPNPNPSPITSTGFARKTPTPIQPTRLVQPTSQSRLTPTIKIPTKIPTKAPTNVPKPTNTPKPTKVPPLPPITTNLRPGTTLRSVFDEVSKRVCIPTALLMAFQTEETGAWISPNAPESFVRLYNTYGWWKTSAADPCRGFGYDESTGLVPSDSYYANRFCMVTPGANPGQMGIFSINQWEQDVTRKYTAVILPNNIDRRVFFDNALIFAIATINRIGSTPKNCTVWSDDEVKIAAEKHQGSCGNNYCADVLKYYKQYR